MNLETLFANDVEESLSDALERDDAATVCSEVRPEEGYRATSLWDSFPGLMPFA